MTRGGPPSDPAPSGPLPPEEAGPDDRELLARHVAGDPDAFGELVRRHQDRLWAVALRTTGDREEAADALQDALVSALRSAAGFRGESAVTTWLYRVVVNASLDRLRRRKVRPTYAFGDQDPPERRDAHAATDLRLDVAAALETLPPGQRAALVLVDLQDVPVAEAACILGVAEGTVKSRCARGRAALAPLLLPDGGRRDPRAAGGNPQRARGVAAGDGPPAETGPQDRADAAEEEEGP